MDNNQSFTWFDQFPTEIIFNIFEYLSCNDIIYTFFYLNQRVNSMLLEHQRYLTYLELPTRDLNFWKNIFLIIGSQIQSLYITSNDLSFALNIFSNLKSINISSSFPFDNHHLNLIIESEQFNKLQSLKIESNFVRQKSPYVHREDVEKILLEKVFNNNNSLQVFEYLPKTSTFSLERIPNLIINVNIQSLSLKRIPFYLAFSIIKYAPNLKHFNLTLTESDSFDQQIDLSDIQLAKFFVTFSKTTYQHNAEGEIRAIINVIKQFSSSLICLSMDATEMNFNERDAIPFHGVKFQQQLLQSMTELKKFHFYAKLGQDWTDVDNILSTFENQFWFDHNWLVGTHGNYLYTLPFQFNHLHDFIDFDVVKSNNLKILNSPRTWHNVKSIEFSRSHGFNMNLIKQLKIKMPKLLTIQFHSNYLYNICETTDGYETLNSVTTVHLTDGSMENVKQWLIYILPNLKYLILSDLELPSSKTELASILNRRIQRLEIVTSSKLEQLTKINNVYFSNVQDIQLTICFKSNQSEYYADDVKKILKYFKNLNKLSINMYGRGTWPEIELNIMLKYFNTNEIERNYEIKRYHEYILFLKKSFYT